MPFALRVPFLALLLALTPLKSPAQGTNVALGSLKGDPTLPVEVTSDQLSVDQAGGFATFTGNVLVGQGTLRMTAATVRVEYGPDGQTVERIHATGGVTLSNGIEAAEGQEAVYTLPTGSVLMTGDVLLTQGASAITGNQLTVDLNTGTGVMEGRVQTVFVPAPKAP